MEKGTCGGSLSDLSIFRHPTLSLVAVLTVILMMILFATTTLLPIYMQDVMQLTAFATGLLLIPGYLLNGMMPVFSFFTYQLILGFL